MMRNGDVGRGLMLLFEALAKAYGAPDPARVARLVMERHGTKTISEQASAEVIADLYLTSSAGTVVR